VPVESLAEGGAERNGIALVPDAGAEVASGSQHLRALGRERVHRRAVAPAVDSVPDVACDAHDCVVVGGFAGLGRSYLTFAVISVPNVSLSYSNSCRLTVEEWTKFSPLD